MMPSCWNKNPCKSSIDDEQRSCKRIKMSLIKDHGLKGEIICKLIMSVFSLEFVYDWRQQSICRGLKV